MLLILVLSTVKYSQQCYPIAEYLFSNVPIGEVQSTVNPAIQPKIQFPSIIDSSKAPNDPVITNKGLTFTDTKYVQINVPWIQNSNACTEVNFWLFYISGDIGSFVGVALQNSNGQQKYMELRATGSATPINLSLYIGGQAVSFGLIKHGWNSIAFGLCIDFLLVNICQSISCGTSNSLYTPGIGNYLGSESLYIGCYSCAATGFSYLVHSLRILSSNSSCSFNPVSNAAPNVFYPCGDGILTNSDQCDDYNLDNGDGCSETCKLEPGYSCYYNGQNYQLCDLCGNGYRVYGEGCDDGNLNSGDGCSSSCGIESGWYCSSNYFVKTSCYENCGDGKRFNSLSTYCDDGNYNSNDGCSLSCNIESGWTCTGGSSSSKDTCSEICGDGKRFNTISSYCDDGNLIDGDGCSATCSIEAYWSCSGGNSSTKDICIDICGDGKTYTTLSTFCDDGNVVSGDGCSSSCSKETGWMCNGGTKTSPDGCSEICGDGIRFNSISTYCDDGNLQDGNGCSSTCAKEVGWLCSGGSSSVKDSCSEICGDGIKFNSISSYCDDGNNYSGDGCSLSCAIESKWTCNGGSSTTKDICTEICGDGVRFNFLITYCDDGNTIDGDGCSSTCSIENGWSCSGGSYSSKDTCSEKCGDGTRFNTLSTYCDDGNTLVNDGCNGQCIVESGWFCTGGNSASKDVCTEICGDEIRFNSLITYCDDGNVIDNDGCSLSCAVEAGWKCSGGSLTSKDACSEICGDGIKFNTVSNYCDDENKVNNDGCNSSCNIETGWLCSGGSKSNHDTCTEVCGDGKRFNSLSTFCDDGNSINGDGCNTSCSVETGWICSGGNTSTKDTCNEICGDGIRFNASSLYCDDSNTISGDGCSSTCTKEIGWTCSGGDSLTKDTCTEICGDGIRFNLLTTYCDDGNTVNGDGCNSSCVVEVNYSCTGGNSSNKDICSDKCGDGVKINSLTTYCDDGNNVNGDGCNSKCNIEVGWKCSGGDLSKSDVCTEICGDGVKFNTISTYCDDGNLIDGDGCDSMCSIETYWLCSGGNSVSKDTCSEICGDGVRLNSLSSYCDDGNLINNDGCSSACGIEIGWFCSGGSSTNSDSCIEVCGDGKRFNSLTTYCDDQNIINGDGCSSNCAVELGWTCSGGTSTTKDSCSEICGDGKRFNTLNSYCDDNNVLDGDGCTSSCSVESDWICSGGSSTTKDTCTEICGDGKRYNTLNTYCDDGNIINNDGCGATCSVETGWQCTGGSKSTSDTCTEKCGDGIRFNSLASYCDDGNVLDGDGCSSSCNIESGWTCSGETCGDGKKESQLLTSCDDGNIFDGDGCSSTCNVEVGWNCSGGSSTSQDICVEICGDGIRIGNDSSKCDDGNTSDGDGCCSLCIVESGWACSGGSSSSKDNCVDICGDGKRYSSASSFCDDGNTSNNDGCDSSCMTEPGWICSGGTHTTKDTCTEICGDSKRFNTLSTYCDDGNVISNDGCSSTCQIENGWSCSGGTSSTKDTCNEICGDGFKYNVLSSYCDDANIVDGGGCSSSCGVEAGWQCSGGSSSSKDTCSEICGDGKRFNSISTYCDDGNSINGDGCSSSCSIEAGWSCSGGNSSTKDICIDYCGDGIKYGSVSTSCDDGNMINNDGCSSSCSIETGWTCSGGTSTTPDLCTEICGDGKRFNLISTYCDDGNLINNDGCDSSCQVEIGWTCSGGTSSNKDTCIDICGDSKKYTSSSSFCDDGNTASNDGCSSTCVIESGWICSGGTPTNKDTCTEICGDSKRFNSISTYCDDGNLINNDGCDSSCNVETGWSCTGGTTTNKDTCRDICGDGLKYTSSSTFCDDGNVLSCDGCSASCTIETGWTCSGGSITTKDTCVEICGDGIRVNSNSNYCDDGNIIDGDGCSSICSVETFYECSGGSLSSKDTCIEICGDSKRLTTSASYCDDGNTNSGDGCSSICNIENGWTCVGGSTTSKDVCSEICGDGIKFNSFSTYCDDGNTNNGDGCSSSCSIENLYSCNGGSSNSKDVCSEICGDGFRINTNVNYCDDGNNSNSDGCNSSCAVETGWICTGGSATSKDSCTEICGDGIKLNSLATYCDDGNTSNGDGCSSTCSIETGYNCIGGSSNSKDICSEVCGDEKKISILSSACDDGNILNSDGCSSLCLVEIGWTCSGGNPTSKDTCSEICGDGKRFNSINSYCDDGNLNNNDGCNSSCAVEAGWQCSGGNTVTNDICIDICGDGLKFSSVSTFCDDNNNANNDGCSSTCTVENGWTCSGGSSTSKDICSEICGDGFRFNSNISYCDDGNSVNNDGCSSLCTVETGWTCSGGTISSKDICSDICGDGLKYNTSSSFCDDGNNSNNDGCNSLCTIETGWTCSGGTQTTKDTCSEICGDSKRFNSLSTYCDDGNTISKDGCDSSCQVEIGWTCSGGTTVSKDNCVEICGDGIRFNSINTYCDDGNVSNGDGCNSSCSIESGWNCNGGTSSTKDICNEICGDGKRFNSLSSYCDDGNTINGDGCNAVCSTEIGYICSGGSSITKDVCSEICGDGIRHNALSSYCDDSNTISNDGCSSTCAIESGWICTGGSLISKDTCVEICGDGVRYNTLSTYCDDGNTVSGDGCSSLCSVEIGFTCSGGTSTSKDICNEPCGDGIRITTNPTYCDDGNHNSGDGCSSSCIIEAGWFCFGGSPSTRDICTEVCGDGVRVNSIQTYCDDGNNINYDGCSSVCSIELGWTCSGGSTISKDICQEICGDGVKYNTNTSYCDDGNSVNGDGCNSNCAIEAGWNCSGGTINKRDMCNEICGDGKRFNKVESYCDDGNTVDGDGCNSSCKVEDNFKCKGGNETTKDLCTGLLVVSTQETAAASTTQAAVGVGTSVSASTSLMSMSSPVGVFAMINQFQMLLLVVISGVYLSDGVKATITGMGFAMFNFDFIKFEKYKL